MADLRLKEIVERLYFHELEQREKINGRLQLPFAVSLAILSGYGYLVSQLKLVDLFYNIFWIYIAFAVGSLITFLLGVYFLRKSWFGYDYEVLPTAKEIVDYQARVDNFYKDLGYGRKLSIQAFQKFEVDYFSKCATTNFSINEARSLLLHKAHKYLFYSAYLVFFSVSIFSVQNIIRIEGVTPLSGYISKLYIVNKTGVVMEPSNTPRIENPKPMSPPNPPQPPPTKLIREGVSGPTPNNGDKK